MFRIILDIFKDFNTNLIFLFELFIFVSYLPNARLNITGLGLIIDPWAQSMAQSDKRSIRS